MAGVEEKTWYLRHDGGIGRDIELVLYIKGLLIEPCVQVPLLGILEIQIEKWII